MRNPSEILDDVPHKFIEQRPPGPQLINNAAVVTSVKLILEVLLDIRDKLTSLEIKAKP